MGLSPPEAGGSGCRDSLVAQESRSQVLGNNVTIDIVEVSPTQPATRPITPKRKSSAEDHGKGPSRKQVDNSHTPEHMYQRQDASTQLEVVVSPISPAVQAVSLGVIPWRPNFNAAFIEAAKVAQESKDGRKAMKFPDPDTPSKQPEFVEKCCLMSDFAVSDLNNVVHSVVAPLLIDTEEHMAHLCNKLSKCAVSGDAITMLTKQVYVQLSGIKDRLDNVDGKFNHVMEKLEEKVDGLNEKIEATNGKLSTVKKKMNDILEKVGVMQKVEGGILRYTHRNLIGHFYRVDVLNF